MFNQISLLIMLLAPVVAYVAGAIIFSVVECLGKSQALTKCNNAVSNINCRNGL